MDPLIVLLAITGVAATLARYRWKAKRDGLIFRDTTAAQRVRLIRELSKASADKHVNITVIVQKSPEPDGERLDEQLLS